MEILADLGDLIAQFQPLEPGRRNGLLAGQQAAQGMTERLHLPLSPHQDGADQTRRHDVMMPDDKARRGLRAGLHVPYGLSGRKSYD